MYVFSYNTRFSMSLSLSFGLLFCIFSTFLPRTDPLFVHGQHLFTSLFLTLSVSPSLPLSLSHTLLHLNIFVIGVLSAFFRLDRTKQPQSCKSKQGNLNSVAARQNMPSKRIVNSANYEMTLSFLLFCCCCFCMVNL